MHVLADTSNALDPQAVADQGMQKGDTGAINDYNNVVLASRSEFGTNQVLLTTVLVNILNHRNEYIQCRELLDTRS